MREEYHIKVDRTEKEHIERAFKYLGVEPNTVISLNTISGSALEYMVELSKYELLYVRLVCKTGAVVNITEWSNNEKLLHLGSKV